MNFPSLIELANDKSFLGQFLKIILVIIFQKTLREIMQDLKHFKNDITLILSKDRLVAYDSLEQYKENLKL
ncbi:hypothetical protein HPHPP41_1278 [Helicobacter pylori Hp P-41]|nr:hypothetical protein HPHPP41_1278 [Helicobacter pylori Hp P-41]